MRQRQPHRADLLPARRDAVEDPARDDQMAARVVVAEREAEPMVVQGDAACRRAARDAATATDQRASPRRYNHLFILWVDSSAGSRRSRWRWARRASSSSPFSTRRFCSLPEINDLLLVWMVTQHKHADACCMPPAPSLGSLAGCLIALCHRAQGRRGACPQALQRRPRRAGAWHRFKRHGVLAVLVPSLLPPPAPFKIFVLLAGVAGISVGRFATAIAIGRGIRYFGAGPARGRVRRPGHRHHP